MPSQPHPGIPDVNTLAGLYYSGPAALGVFREIRPVDVPGPYRRLLAHHRHMTVTVERFHNCRVRVKVLDRMARGSHYSRKILLARETDDQVVQFGIMRVDLNFLAAEVRAEIEREQVPLGRILIEHNVLRRVQYCALWQVTMGEELARLFSSPSNATTYGRTAVIECNHLPAVELLEIVAPIRS